MSGLSFLTKEELIQRKRKYISDIRELYKVLDLIPETTFLGIMSIKSSIKKKQKHLLEIKEALKNKENPKEENNEQN